MNETAIQTRTAPPEGRSLRGATAALSTLAAIAGPAFSTARFEQVVVAGDHVQVTYDAVTAEGVANALGIGGVPVTWHAERHQWTGHVAGLKVDIHGRGVLPSQVPAALIRDVMRADAGHIPLHVVLEVAAIAVAVALSFVLPIGTAAALIGGGLVLSVLAAWAGLRIQDAGRRRAHAAGPRTLASDLYAAALALGRVGRHTPRVVTARARQALRTPDQAYDAHVEPLTDARRLVLSAGEIR